MAILEYFPVALAALGIVFRVVYFPLTDAAASIEYATDKPSLRPAA